MAEINVEKKQKKPVWPWIIAILLIGGLIWLFTGVDNDEEYETAETEYTQPAEESQTQPITEATNPITSFIAFVNENNGDVSLSHNYTQDGLQHLAEAMAYLNDQHQSVNGNQHISTIKQTASNITHNTYSEQHADKIRMAFLATASFMQDLPSSAFPELQDEADDIKDAAESIKSKELATNQANDIQNFFDEVADAFAEIENV